MLFAIVLMYILLYRIIQKKEIFRTKDLLLLLLENSVFLAYFSAFPPLYPLFFVGSPLWISLPFYTVRRYDVGTISEVFVLTTYFLNLKLFDTYLHMFPSQANAYHSIAAIELFAFYFFINLAGSFIGLLLCYPKINKQRQVKANKD